MLNRFLRTFSLLGALCGAVACGSSSTPTDGAAESAADVPGADTSVDAAPTTDAQDVPATMDVASDSQVAPDAPDVVAPDAGRDAGADASTDVARDATGDVCDPSALEATMPMGVCDGRGMIACSMWAQTNAGGNPNATAVCLVSPSGCARADACGNRSDPSTCTCGGAPACAPGSVCVGVGPTSRCAPIPCP